MATFISNGTPITEPSPQYDIPLVSNNGVLKARHQSGLPLGYTLLDYIETDGNSYIDTNLLLSNTSEFEITFQSADATLSTPVMGAISGGTSYTSTNNLSVTYNVTSGLSAYAVYCDGAAGDANHSWNGGDRDDGLKHTIKYNGLNIAPTIDGVAMTQITPITLVANTPTVTTWLFGRNNTSTGTLSQAGVRIYDFKVGGVAHFVPCKNASNVVGMYDTVNRVFYQNAGTGDFVAGNPVSDPVEIYTDGTVETIWAHGKNLFDKDTITVGYYYNPSGVYSVSSDGMVSNWIPISSNTTLTLTATIPAGGTVGSNRRVNYFDANKNWLSQTVSQVGGNNPTYTFTTPENTKYIRISWSYNGTYALDTDHAQLELGSTATDYEPYFNGGTATTEMLLKVGDYQDVQSIIDGVVTRNVGVKVLDGTEYWRASYTYQGSCYINNPDAINNVSLLCTHFVSATRPSVDYARGKCLQNGTDLSLWFGDNASTAVAYLKQFLADQYAAGTPVIVLYPLATPTTESVAGQTLQVQDGDNVLEITQASLSGLELEAEYEKVA